MLNKLIVVSNKLKNIDSQRIVFGSKNLFYKRIKNKITKQEFKDSRLCNLFISGETSYKGNRHCLLDMKNRTLTIKVNKQIKPIVLSIPKNFKNLEEELCKLVEQCNKKENKFSVVIKNDTVSISYEEFKNEEVFEKINNRILAFDDNPNYIGISITDWKNKENIKPSRIIYQEVIDKTNLIDGRYEGDTKKKFVKNATTNKIKYETFIISKHIIKLCKHFKCSMIVKENLVIYSSNKKKGRKFNRLCNNDWNRTLFSNNLKKKCVENNIDLVEVNCANSSKLGNVLYGKDDGTIPDMIASSIELARRSFKYYKAKNNKFYFNKDERLYPEWNILKKELNRWKKEALQSSCME